jgi:replicative DNA helicase
MREQRIQEQVARMLGEEARWAEAKSVVTGLDTGFPSINLITGGLHRGEMTVLGARTSHGKTSLGISIGFNAALEGIRSGNAQPVLFFSPEMTAAQLLHRYACQIAEVPGELLRRGIANEEQRGRYRSAVEMLTQMEGYLRLFAGQSMSATEIVDALEETVQEGVTPSLVVVDYIQRLKADDGGSSGDYARLSQISTTLKDAANTYEIPFLVLSQLSRGIERDRQMSRGNGGEERPPSLSDLRGSGRIEEDADSVWLLWRPPLRQAAADDTPQNATLVIEKNRNGPVGAASLKFIPRLTLFVDGGERKVRTDGGHEAW